MVTTADLLDIAREALIIVILLSLPLLAAAFVASLLSAALQSLTRVSEPGLTQVPRIAAVGITATVASPWISGRIAGFAERIWSLMQAVNL
jgi:flagellar biosynthesis protein FliQ